MTAYEKLQEELRRQPRTWLVTGAAGFIGSHLVETLLKLDQFVVGLDNFSTGSKSNLEDIQTRVTREQWKKFRFIEGDIVDLNTCLAACQGTEYVLHQAALGSVPRSIADPLGTHANNVTGFINMLEASRRVGIKRFVYASSSSVYGDDPNLPKIENRIGVPLSPYAASKLIDEIYAGVYARTYGLETIGLRYFNVFGPRQDPNGPYAAVIPRWIAAIAKGHKVEIYGDGLTSRDFCYVANVVQANLLAALANSNTAINRVFNIGTGQKTTLNQLYQTILEITQRLKPGLTPPPVEYKDFRPGDVRHSQADITAAETLLGYRPTHYLRDGLEPTVSWFFKRLINNS